MDEAHVRVQAEIGPGPRHRHQRRDSAAARQVELAARRGAHRSGRKAELPGRAGDGDPVARAQVVVQPVRHPPAGHALDGDGHRAGPRRAGAQGVAAHHALAVDVQRQGDELAGTVAEAAVAVVQAQHEGAHVRGLVDHPQADEDLVVRLPDGGGRIGQIGIDGIHGSDRGISNERAQAAPQRGPDPRAARMRSTYQTQKASTRPSVNGE